MEPSGLKPPPRLRGRTEEERKGGWRWGACCIPHSSHSQAVSLRARGGRSKGGLSPSGPSLTHEDEPEICSLTRRGRSRPRSPPSPSLGVRLGLGDVDGGNGEKRWGALGLLCAMLFCHAKMQLSLLTISVLCLQRTYFGPGPSLSIDGH